MTGEEVQRGLIGLKGPEPDLPANFGLRSRQEQVSDPTPAELSVDMERCDKAIARQRGETGDGAVDDGHQRPAVLGEFGAIVFHHAFGCVKAR